MERLTIDDVEQWLLSGVPVVRLAGRDFGQTVDEYTSYLYQLGEQLSLGIEIREIVDPPGVVLQAYLGDTPPVLEVPLFKVSKADTAWLFCLFPKCRNRVDTPGSMCEAHA